MKKKKLLNYKTLNRTMLIVLLVIEVVVFSSLTPYFLKLANILSIGREIATLGIVAIGQTMCILLGGFDLAAGGIAAAHAGPAHHAAAARVVPVVRGGDVRKSPLCAAARSARARPRS